MQRVYLSAGQSCSELSRVVTALHTTALQAFDELLLLKRGGENIYNGPLGRDAESLIAYLSAIPGVPPIKPRSAAQQPASS